MERTRVIKIAAVLFVAACWSGAGTGYGGESGEVTPVAGTVRSVWNGVYTAEQADRGQTVYASNCQLCHGVEMHGGPGIPGVAGPEFMFKWNSKTAAELFVYLRSTMPPGQAGSLSDQQYTDLIAEILRHNGFPAGEVTVLPVDPEVLKQVLITREKP